MANKTICEDREQGLNLVYLRTRDELGPIRGQTSNRGVN